MNQDKNNTENKNLVEPNDNQVATDNDDISNETETVEVENNDEKLQAETITGQKINGNSIILSSDGFIISQNNGLVEYKIGMPVTSYAHPKGFKLAQLQRGDVASTGLLLLEKMERQHFLLIERIR